MFLGRMVVSSRSRSYDLGERGTTAVVGEEGSTEAGAGANEFSVWMGGDDGSSEMRLVKDMTVDRLRGKNPFMSDAVSRLSELQKGTWFRTTVAYARNVSRTAF